MVFLLPSCAINPVTGKKEVMFMSEEQEIAIGREADPQIVSMYGHYEDADLQKFIQERGTAMAAISHRAHLNFEFKILDSPVVNAFAVPGGYVYFTRGILAHFTNEAEFAGVLGHEIGHVTARHSAQQQTKATIAQVLFVGGLIVSPAFRAFSDVAQQSLQLLFLKYSRDNETQSDELGVEYSTKIGYDAHHMAQFFRTLDRLSGDSEAGSLPTFLSTHPHPVDRFRKVERLATEWQSKTPSASYVTNRNEYLRRIDGLIYGEDPRQGYVENNVFYHPVMLFQYPIPSGWRTHNSPQQVQMAPQDGKAVIILTLTPGNSLEQAANDILTKYELKLIDSKKVTVHNLPALAMLSDQVNQESGQTLRIQTYLIQYNDLIYTFHGLSLAGDFHSYQQHFNATMTGFNVLRDRAKINVKPEKISIETVSRTGTLSTIFSQFQVPQNRHEELAVLNGLTLDQTVERGTLIKIVAK